MAVRAVRSRWERGAAVSARDRSRLDPIARRYGGLLSECDRRLRDEAAELPDAELLSRFLATGKKFRALLVLVSGAAVGGDARRLVPAATGIELLHAASLVHDDVIDGAVERRGLPALHVELGSPAALVVGDYLLLRAFATVARGGEGLGEGARLAAIDVLAGGGSSCCLGALAEIRGQARPSVREYFRLVRGKTGALVAAATALGAVLGGASAAERGALRRYGLLVGTAFQIRDDVLELSDGAASTGDAVQGALGCVEVQERLAAKARRALEPLRPGRPRRELEELARFAIERET
jgi:geranylgeranyl diphosphate synthase, type I